MRLIAHRGNLFGAKPEKENTYSYIKEALDAGFDCELDVRYVNGHFFLGHDEQRAKIDLGFLQDNRLWVHCKNIEALVYLSKMPTVNCFYHNMDPYTLTSHGFIWCYPGYRVVSNSNAITVSYNKEQPNDNFLGVCSDFVGFLRK